MRRVKFLITEIRRSTGNTDTNAKTDNDFIFWLNRGMKSIQRVVCQSMAESNPFGKTVYYDFVADQEAYALPIDIFAQADIVSIETSSDSQVALSRRSFHPLRFISPKDRNTNYGYFILGNDIHLIPVPQQSRQDAMRLSYISQLPSLGKRVGEVSAFTSGVSITVTGVDLDDINISEVDDYVTVVDFDGNVRLDNDGNIQAIKITSFTPATGVLLTSSTFENVVNGDYLIAGKYATSHPLMPNACEDYLLTFCERKLFHAESSTDVKDQDIFTERERQELNDLFANNTHDAKYPPIVDTTYSGI